MSTGEDEAGFAGDLWYGDAWSGRDFRGERVGVIASGSDAARVVPEALRTARSVKLFLDDPDWVLPPLSVPLGPRARRLMARAHLRLAVRDPWQRRLLTPDDRFTSHVTATSSRFYTALQDPRCTLVRWPVYAVTPRGVRTAEGIEHQVDCLVVPDTGRLRRLTLTTRPREDRTA